MRGAAKICFVLLFVWLTNTGLADRMDLLIATERFRGAFLFFGFWLVSIACLLIAAFLPNDKWRLFWAGVFALTTFIGYSFMRIAGSQLTVYHVFNLWVARDDASRAFGFYANEILLSLVVSGFGFFVLALRPPALAPLSSFLPVSLRRPIKKFGYLAALLPAVPFVALVLVMMFRVHDDTPAMPTQFVSAATSIIAISKLANYERLPRKRLLRGPLRSPAARHVVFIMDESVTADFISLEPGNPVTPYLASIRDKLVDFGLASSGSNCSANSNAIIRFGAGKKKLQKSLINNPYIWEYAKMAGFRTVLIDATASHNKNPGSLHNYMTPAERAMVDEYIIIKGVPSAELDLKAARKITLLLTRATPQFIYINKNGAHFPYNESYPAAKAIVALPPDEGNSLIGIAAQRRKASYQNAIHWSVDVFLKSLLETADLSRTAVLYTSDHGQNLDPEKLTHCTVETADASEGRVPMMFFTGIASLKERFAEAARINFNKTTHFAVFPTLIELFGYDYSIRGKDYSPGLLRPLTQHQAFVSGDLFGIFQKEVFWHPIGQ